MGGAYGGFCRFSAASGVFSYLSYRDPNVKGTLDNYDNAAQHLQQLELSPAELSQAIIGAVGDLDRPMQPDQKGFASLQQFLAGETAEERQARRSELLATTAADFHAFGERLEQLKADGSVHVIGSAAAIEGANEQLEKKLDVKELL